MGKLAVTALLVTTLMGPVVVFRLLKSRSSEHGLATAIAVAGGWGLNVAWAWATHESQTSQGGTASDPPQASGDNLSLAIRFGWACPTVLGSASRK